MASATFRLAGQTMQPCLPAIPSSRVIGDRANRYLRWLREECADFAGNPTIFAWFDIVVGFIRDRYADWDRTRKKDFAHATGEILAQVREVHHNGSEAVAHALASSLQPTDFRVRWLGIPSSHPSLLAHSTIQPSHTLAPHGAALPMRIDPLALPSLSDGLPGVRGRQELPSLQAVFPIDPAIEYGAHQVKAPHGHHGYSAPGRHSPPARAASLGMSLLSDRQKSIYARAQRL